MRPRRGFTQRLATCAWPTRPPRSRARMHGFALVFVLWLGLLLTVLAAGAVLGARAQLAASDAALAQVQAGALAEAGVRRAVLGLLDRKSRSEWDSGLTVDWRFAGGVVRLTVSPEAARVDLNSARAEVIEGLLARIALRDDTLEEDAATALADAILDWRDRDKNRRPFGAEAAEYSAAGRPYVPRDGRFESVAELGQILGMTDRVVGMLAAQLTVYARSPRVSALAASRETLMALPGATEAAVDAFLDERATFLAAKGEAAAATQGQDRRQRQARLSVTALGPAARYVSRGAGRVFAVRAEALAANGSKALRRVVLRLGGSGGRPFDVLAWSQLWEEDDQAAVDAAPS